VPPARGAHAPLYAYAVLQLGDCTSNLSFLSIFRRPPVMRGIRLAGLLLAGSGSVAAAERALGPALAAVGVRAIDRRTEATLLALGHRATPFLVVLDSTGVVAFSAGAPESPEGQITLGRILQQLADHAAGGR
jgi:hypothetical protein